MATSRLINHYISSGGIIRSMKDRFNYGKDKDKTNDGELIASYMCDPETAHAEFLLSKARYKAITGREQKRDENILCYQIRQSFMQGEIDAESALKVGYDLAMRWTKGRHAFFVVSHIDRPHPHVHIYYNSTTLDCTHKYRDFLRSARALRRLSDRICYENNLSVIKNPKQKSKGKFMHYGQWFEATYGKAPTYQDRLRVAIDVSLSEKPKDIETFLSSMTAKGYEHKIGRGDAISFRVEGQERFTRLRSSTLGEGYGYDDIIAIIEGRTTLPSGRINIISQKPSRKVNLIIDIQEKLKEGKGAAYQQWAKIYNLKQMAAALQYLQENDLLNYEDLETKTETAVDGFHVLSEKIKAIESKQKHNSGLREVIVEYARTRPVFEEYKAKKYSSKFLAEHEDDIRDYRTAQSAMKELLQGKRLPKMDELKTEANQLASDKKALYSQYRSMQKDMREAVAVKSNVDHLLGITDGRKNKEMER